MTAYELDGVRFAYGTGAPVLTVPRLELSAGGVTAFLGPNGSGKTTLLHLLSFLEEPTAGHIRFFGEAVRTGRLPALRRQVCLLLQNPYLFRGSVQTNVEWALKVRGVSAAVRRRAAEQALKQVDLYPLRKRHSRELSGGERQRVALARVLALDPRAVCLDEPTNHLDAAGRASVERILATWVAERGVTLVVATHDVGLAHRLGAQTWRLQGGDLLPAEPDNVLQGRVSAEDPRCFVTEGVALVVNPLAGDVSWVRIGPREVVLSTDVQASSARNQLRGHIGAVAALSDDELLVTVECGITLHAVITRSSWQSLRLERGGPVVAAFKASAVRVC